jgi:hypothetical protein
MPSRLRRIDITALVDKSGSDNSQVPSAGATLAFYRQGATVSAAGPITVATNTVVGVYNSGRLAVGDTVQKGTSGANTATVTEITSPTSVKLTITPTHSLSLSQYDRLVVTNSRPTIYRESSGVAAAASSPNPVTGADGSGDFFSTEPYVDLIVSGGTPSITATPRYDVAAGYLEPRPWVSVLDYGGHTEAALRAAIAALPSGGGVVYIPAGTITLSSTLNILDNAIHILGDGVGSTIIRGSVANPAHHLISIQNNFTVLERLEIDGRADRGGSPGNYDCVRINKASTAINNNYIRECLIHSAQRHNLYVNDVFDTYIRDTGFLYAFGESVFGETSGFGNITHLYFQNCEFDGNDLSTLPPTAPADKPAVKIISGYSVRFIDCRFEGNRGGATFANSLYTYSVTALTLINCHFELNGVSGSDYYPTSRPVSFIYAEASRGAVFIGCSFNGSTTAAVCPTRCITLINSHYWSVLGGKMASLDTWAIQADDDSPGFHSNVLIDPSTGGATAHNLGRGSGGFHEGLLHVPRYTTATRPTAAAAINGALYYDTTTDDLFVCAGGSWVVVGTQT